MSSEEEANFLANYLGDLEKKILENDLGEFASSSYGPYGYGGTVVVGFGFAALLMGRFCNLVVVSKMFVFSMHS